MLELQKKAKEDADKNRKFEEHNEGKPEKDQEGKCKIQTAQVKGNKGSNANLLLNEGKDADYHVQQGIRKSTMNSLNITSLDKNKEENCKKVIQNERSEEQNESKKEKEQESSFEEEPLEKQQEKEEDVNGEFITDNNINHTLKENNIDSGSNILINDEKDQSYYRLKQGIPRSTKFRSIINIYKCTNRLSSPEKEYNWSRLNTLENHNSQVHNEGKTGKDQEDSIEEELPDQQQQQKDIAGEHELNRVTGEDSLPDNSDHVLNDNDDNCGSKLLIRDENDRNYRITQEIPRSITFRSIINLYKCTNRLSAVEEEYNWNLLIEEDPNTNLSTREDSSNKKNIGCKRK
ncbi:hypothetical protein RND71_040594 [Anisodus tanguticus]|uniref:Uncharacterized protein n=1 Tax=Anisodus tanguticus TaxID=243964 RepID=A0AAE1QVV9_9SOLA|nr:hypothetical protein RND71_040594 [Anisodus tanguticus]